MRAILLIVLGAVAATCLGGCQKAANAQLGAAAHHGRYVGIGLYTPGQMWSQMVVATQPKEAAAARTNDDEQVIVVIDSDTGEIRQCGNLSGYCVSTNPWRKPLVPTQNAPITLGKHADQLAREAEAVAQKDVAHPPR